MAKKFNAKAYDIEYVGDEQYVAVSRTQGVAMVGPRTDTGYDVAWELADGRLVALKISRGGGCPTCGCPTHGDYGGEQSWFILTPRVSRNG